MMNNQTHLVLVDIPLKMLNRVRLFSILNEYLPSQDGLSCSIFSVEYQQEPDGFGCSSFSVEYLQDKDGFGCSGFSTILHILFL
jgi:hypothetical protein